VSSSLVEDESTYSPHYSYGLDEVNDQSTPQYTHNMGLKPAKLYSFKLYLLKHDF